MELTKISLPQSCGTESISRQADLLREQLGSAMRIVDRMVATPVANAPDQSTSERDIRAILKLRRNRDRFFDSELFADPAWDMLLELYAAALGQLRVSVSSLCSGAAVPATTALRWIGHLEQKGLITRRADPTDGRRCFLMLTSDGFAAMNAYFQTVPSSSRII